MACPSLHPVAFHSHLLEPVVPRAFPVCLECLGCLRQAKAFPEPRLRASLGRLLQDRIGDE